MEVVQATVVSICKRGDAINVQKPQSELHPDDPETLIFTFPEKAVQQWIKKPNGKVKQQICHETICNANRTGRVLGLILGCLPAFRPCYRYYVPKEQKLSIRKEEEEILSHLEREY